MYQSILVLNPFSFLFLQTSLFIKSISPSFDLFDIWALNFLLPCFLLQSLCFFIFLMLWMLVTVNRAKFLLQKKMNPCGKTPVLVWMLVTVKKIEFTSWKILIIFTWSLMCTLTSAIIIFFEAHVMSCFHTWNFKLE